MPDAKKNVANMPSLKVVAEAEAAASAVMGLTLQQRQNNLKKNFDTLEGQRKTLQGQIEALTQEMLRMQGEYRLLEALIQAEKKE